MRAAVGATQPDKVTLEHLKSGSYLAHCKTAEIQRRLALQNELGKAVVSCSLPQPTTARVVYNTPHGTQAQNINRFRNAIADAAAVERLKSKNNEDTKAVKVTFMSAFPPKFVHVGTTVLPVSPFAAPVRRRTKCQRIGHSKQH